MTGVKMCDLFYFSINALYYISVQCLLLLPYNLLFLTLSIGYVIMSVMYGVPFPPDFA